MRSKVAPHDGDRESTGGGGTRRVQLAAQLQEQHVRDRPRGTVRAQLYLRPPATEAARHIAPLCVDAQAATEPDTAA